MLKLERKSRDQCVHLRLRSPEAFLCPAFRKALLLAVALHVFAFFLFQISPLKITFSTTVYPPVSVETVFRGGTAVGEFEKQTSSRWQWLEPSTSTPKLPELPPITTPTLTAIPPPIYNTHLFEQLEDRTPLLPTLPPGHSFIHISGNLPAPSKMTIPENIHVEEEALIVFNVQVDAAKGDIFWYELISSPHPLQQAAEDLLDQLQFSHSNEIIAKGQVEFHFFPNGAP